MSAEDRLTGLVGFSGTKVPVRAATTAAITLSGEQTIDGVACVTDDRVLVKDQASSVDNGIYVVDTGAWSLAPDADGVYDWRDGSLLFVNEGTVNGLHIFRAVGTDEIDPGTDAIDFVAITFEVTGAPETRWAGTATGTANDLVLTPATAVSALAAGLTVVFKSSASGNTAATTIAVSGLAATAAQTAGLAMIGGEIEASQWYRATYDGAAFQVEQFNPGKVPQAFVLSGDISISLTGNQNDWAPAGLAGASTIRVDANGDYTITGITGGADGRILIIQNVDSANTLTLANEDAGSAAANRFQLEGGTARDLVLKESNCAILQYDGTSSVWRLLATSASPYIFATQAEQEAGGGSSNYQVVTPAFQQYHDSAAKAWMKTTVAAGTPTLIDSYNTSSIADTGTGVLTWNIDTNFSTADWACHVSSERESTALAVANDRKTNVQFGGQAAGSCILECFDSTAVTNVVKDPTAWHAVGFGDQ